MMRGELTALAHQQVCDLVRERLTALIGDAKSPLHGEHWKKFLAAWSEPKAS